jgi:hypothetical protein
MNRFHDFLKEIGGKLEIPQPIKSRIILEIAADLEALYQHYLKQGNGKNAALKKAQEKIDFSDDALRQLTQIHASSLQKYLDKLSEHAQTRWERSSLGIILLTISVPSVYQIIITEFFRNASVFIWPILAITIFAGIIFLLKFYQIFIKKDHAVYKIHEGLSLIFILAAGSLVVTVCGYFVELYSLKSENLFYAMNPLLLVLLNLDIPAHNDILIPTAQWLIKSSSMVMFGLLATIFILLFWFVLSVKVKNIEEAESSTLLKA